MRLESDILIPKVPVSNTKISVIPLTFEGKSFEIKYKKSTYKEKTHFKIEFEDLKNISETLDKPIRDVELFLRKEIEKKEDL